MQKFLIIRIGFFFLTESRELTAINNVAYKEIEPVTFNRLIFNQFCSISGSNFLKQHSYTKLFNSRNAQKTKEVACNTHCQPKTLQHLHTFCYNIANIWIPLVTAMLLGLYCCNSVNF